MVEPGGNLELRCWSPLFQRRDSRQGLSLFCLVCDGGKCKMISSHGFPFVSQVSSLDRKLCFAERGLRGGPTPEKRCEGPPSPEGVGQWRRGGVGAGLLAGGGAPSVGAGLPAPGGVCSPPTSLGLLQLPEE